MKKRSFERYLALYTDGNRERRLHTDPQKVAMASKRNKDALKNMVALYPEQAKAALLQLSEDRDVWLALGAAWDCAHNFKLTQEEKKALIQTANRCEACRTCTGVEKVSLIIFRDYVRNK